MKKLLIVALSILMFTVWAFADETGGKFGLGVKGGATRYFGDLDQAHFGSYYDFNAQWWITNIFGISFTYGKGYLFADEHSDYFKTNLWNYTGLLKIKLWQSCKLNPYLAVGYEKFDIDPKKRNGRRATDFAKGMASSAYQKVNSAAPFGIGFSYFLSEHFAIETEALFHYSSIDYIDGYDRGSKNDNWVSAAAGLSVFFGKAKDTDKDGIPDNIDKDPLHAEDFDHFQDQDGAPDYDNDQDGVPDVADKAPLKPEDHDGYMDADGVPDPDNDGDGILDVNDKCPGTDSTVANGIDTKEDMDGFQDDDGCPDLDNDGDGIPDIKDKCPNKAETKNGYEDDDGCPDKKPEIAVEKGKAIVLEGVNFASGSARLTANSKKILDKVVRTLTDEPEIEVEIRGYTDNTGSLKGNLKISQRRADSVKKYLVSKGIDVNRIQTKGFGPQDPIAPNSTRTGRAQNRRIEFFRIK